MLIISKMTTPVNPFSGPLVRIRVTGYRRNDRDREEPLYRNDDKASPAPSNAFSFVGTCHSARHRTKSPSTPLHARCLTLPQGLIRPPQTTRVSGIYKAGLLPQDGPLPRFGPFAAVYCHALHNCPSTIKSRFYHPPTITKRIWSETYNIRNF